MALLEWRLTLLGLVLLPLFLLPARRVGRRLQAITREGMDLNASMNTTMTERFGVAGALLVKLFGRYDDEVGELRRPGRPGARHRRAVGDVQPGVLRRPWRSSARSAPPLVYLIGGRLVLDDAITLGTLVALGTFVTRLYAPLQGLTNARVDVMTAFVCFDRVFEVLDTPSVDRRPPRRRRPRLARTAASSSTTCRFRYPAASEVSIASLEDGPGAARDSAGVEVLHGIDAVVEPGQLVALVGPSGAGKTTLARSSPGSTT